VLLTSPQGGRIEYVGTPSTNSGTVNLVEGKVLADIRVVSEFLDVFPEDLPGMPPDRILSLVLNLYLVLLLYQKDLIEWMLKI
jgi:hypothetical protein